MFTVVMLIIITVLAYLSTRKSYRRSIKKTARVTREWSMLFLVKCITTIVSVNVSISSMLLWLTWIWKFLKCCFPQPTVCILYSLLWKAIHMGSVPRTICLTVSCQSATKISDASLLIYAVFIDLKCILIVSLVRFRDCQLVFLYAWSGVYFTFCTIAILTALKS